MKILLEKFNEQSEVRHESCSSGEDSNRPSYLLSLVTVFAVPMHEEKAWVYTG